MTADFFDELSTLFSKKAKEFGDKAENFCEVQKIRSKIHAEEAEIEKIKKELGEMVYKKYQDGNAVDQDMCLLCEDITKFNRKILRYKEAIAELNGQKVCPFCMKKIDKEARFCQYCGAIWEEPAKEEESEPETAEQEEASETACEKQPMEEETVAEIVEEAVEKAVTEESL